MCFFLGWPELKATALPVSWRHWETSKDQNMHCMSVLNSHVHFRVNCLCNLVYDECISVLYGQVALDVIEELCYEMALQRIEAMDEYTIFIVTNRGTDLNSLNSYKINIQFILDFSQFDKYLIWQQNLFCRSERAAAEQEGVHPGYCHGGGANRQQLQLLVQTGDLGPAAQVWQWALRHHAL